MSELDVQRLKYTGFYDSESRPVRGVVPVEAAISLVVNGQTVVDLMCSPSHLEDLAVGFLFNEGLIESLDDVAVAELCADGRSIDIWLEHDIDIPRVRAITSGCSGGTTFGAQGDLTPLLESSLVIAPDLVTTLMGKLSEEATLYRRAGGVHVAALALLDEENPLVCVAEDIGRHNTLDKVAGACLRGGRSTHDSVVLTSGRVSSEMVVKVARMGAPVVVSRTSPTSLAIELADASGITLIGYTRRRSFRVYTGEERIAAEPDRGGGSIT